jgi:hypothetical protein
MPSPWFKGFEIFLNLRSSVKICGEYVFSDFGNLWLLAKLVVTE